jgi:hypothetical protein
MRLLIARETAGTDGGRFETGKTETDLKGGRSDHFDIWRTEAT